MRLQRARTHRTPAVPRPARHTAEPRSAMLRLTPRERVSDIVKEHAERLRLDPTQFAGHSLRAGFLTSAAARGASIFKMMDVSRHRSVDTLRGYVRDAELFKDHAGRGCFRPRAHRRAMTAAEAAVLPYKK